MHQKMNGDSLRLIQEWYSSQCDGEWEEEFGVKIETIANPGWGVFIDLKRTRLEKAQFAEISDVDHETDWISCRVRDGKFEAAGGPLKLEEILQTFLEWAAENERAR